LWWILWTAQAQYRLFQQQGSLGYALNVAALSLQPNQKSVVDRLYQISLIDRSVAMETIIGELGKVNIVDFKSQRETYLAMIEAAKKDMSLATYTKIDEFEKGIMSQASIHMTDLQKNLAEESGCRCRCGSAKAYPSYPNRSRVNLSVGCEPAVDAGDPNKTSTEDSEGPSEQRVLELTTAQQVLANALVHVKRMDDPPSSRLYRLAGIRNSASRHVFFHILQGAELAAGHEMLLMLGDIEHLNNK
jgi:hypothetical protein